MDYCDSSSYLTAGFFETRDAVAAGRFNTREAGSEDDELTDAYSLHHVSAVCLDTNTALRR